MLCFEVFFCCRALGIGCFLLCQIVTTVLLAITDVISIPCHLQVLEEVLHNLEQDGTMSVEDFFYGLFKNGKSLTPSASTPYRQLKRHLSMQVRIRGKSWRRSPEQSPSSLSPQLPPDLSLWWGSCEGPPDPQR